MNSLGWTIEVFARDASAPDPRGLALEDDIRTLGWASVPRVVVTDIYFLRARLDGQSVAAAATTLFSDPVTQDFAITAVEASNEISAIFLPRVRQLCADRNAALLAESNDDGSDPDLKIYLAEWSDDLEFEITGSTP